MEKGILAIYKPRGITSYDVIRVLKRIFPGEKIGHGGTLDPLAEGVLVVAVGRDATKQLHTVLNGTEKEYETTIELGKVSETDDAEGPIHQYLKARVGNPDLLEITTALQSFTGDIDQVPPQYSAVKVQGKTAYKRAREGENTTLAPKKVHISSIDVLSYSYPMLTIRVVCGSGVYIRSIARDLGETLQTGGYVTNLKRTRVGEFTAEKAQHLPDNQ
jgi:tRNA pseudouridine55 synthase